MAETEEPYAILRKILPFTTVAVIIAALYVGWIFYSRWSGEREARQAQKQHEVDSARQTLDLLGGGNFKILSFYAVPGAIERGGRATVCYGVSDAKSVRIEPEIEPIKPALSRCVEAKPKATTQYTLTAEDGKGHTLTQSFTLQVVK